MTLFKNKKPIPMIYVLLDNKLKEALEQKHNCFYYPLLDQEVFNASNWAFDRCVCMEVSHKNGNTIVYKFTDF